MPVNRLKCIKSYECLMCKGKYDCSLKPIYYFQKIGTVMTGIEYLYLCSAKCRVDWDIYCHN